MIIRDELSDIFSKQAELMLMLGGDPNVAPDLTTDEEFKHICLMLISEVSEVVNPLLVSTKPWKQSTPVSERIAESRDEIVDVFFLFIEMCLRAGISSQQLVEMYNRKWSRNVKRYEEALRKLNVVSVERGQMSDVHVKVYDETQG